MNRMTVNRNSGSARALFLAALSAGMLAAALSVPANAQTAAAGAITGTVKDASGAVLPEATVVAHNAGTGADTSVTSNAAGVYIAPFLQPGQYELSASKAGFAK